MNSPLTRTPDHPRKTCGRPPSSNRTRRAGASTELVLQCLLNEWRLPFITNTLLPWRSFLRGKKSHELHIASRKQTETISIQIYGKILQNVSPQHPHTKHPLTAWIPNSSLWGSPAFTFDGFLTRFRDRMSHISQPLGVCASNCQNRKIF